MARRGERMAEEQQSEIQMVDAGQIGSTAR